MRTLLVLAALTTATPAFAAIYGNAIGCWTNDDLGRTVQVGTEELMITGPTGDIDFICELGEPDALQIPPQARAGCMDDVDRVSHFIHIIDNVDTATIVWDDVPAIYRRCPEPATM